MNQKVKKMIARYILTISVVLSLISCDNTYERDFFSKVAFKRTFEGDNMWFVDSLGTKEDSLIKYKMGLKFRNLSIDSYCAYNNDAFYIYNNNSFVKYFDFKIKVGEGYVTPNGEMIFLGKKKENYIYLLINSLKIYDEIPSSEYSIWIINKDSGFTGFAYYNDEVGSLEEELGNTNIIDSNIIQDLKNALSKT